MPVENADTQIDDEQVVDNADEQANSGSDDGDSGEQDESTDGYFLDVDERTKYKTREEAVKGFQNAGRRIAELSAWEQDIKDAYGVENPQQVAQILDEYIELKEAQAKAAAKESGDKGESATHTVDLSKLTPKEQEAFKWLQKVAPELGYVPKSELKALQDEIGAIKNGLGNFEQVQEAQKVAAGRSQITQLLTAAKLPVEPEFTSFVEDAMAAWIKADAKRVSQWKQGGPVASNLLNEAFAYVKGHLGRLGVSKTASYQGSKQNGGNKTSIKRLPQQGQALRKGGAPVKQQPKKQSDADIHNAAWALAQKRWGGATDDSGE